MNRANVKYKVSQKKRGQEEIVGFVLIVVIVVIIFVIFLGIKLRNPEPQQRESEIIYQFLESAMEQTTECELNTGGRVLSLDELVKECYSRDLLCVSGDSSCEVAEKTLKKILNNTWKVGADYPYKGYEVKANYFYNSSEHSQNEEVFLITAGNCTTSFTANSYWIAELPGNIVVDAKLCT